MKQIVEPRVAEMRQHGNAQKADELERMFEEAIQESKAYIVYSEKQQGQ